MRDEKQPKQTGTAAAASARHIMKLTLGSSVKSSADVHASRVISHLSRALGRFLKRGPLQRDRSAVSLMDGSAPCACIRTDGRPGLTHDTYGNAGSVSVVRSPCGGGGGGGKPKEGESARSGLMCAGGKERTWKND